MSQIRILLAEDNPLHASKMEMLLDLMGYELVGVGSTEQQVKDLFVKHTPDLVILDISLSEEGDGVRLASDIQGIKSVPIIFLTSFEDKETMHRALQMNPFAYLVKPAEKGNLQAAIELAVSKAGLMPEVEISNRSASLLADSFFVKAGSKLQKVRLSDVLWVEVAQERYCDVVTSERRYQVRSSLSQLEARLNPQVFMRIHRTTIINTDYIDGIDEFEMMVDIGGNTLPLGGAFKSALLSKVKLI